MKLYDIPGAPSPRRVRIFAAEKGLSIPSVVVDTRGGEHLTPAYRAKNPRCTAPILELDDGTCLWETLAICSYLEDLQPDPPLLGGRDSVARAVILQWNALIEQDGFLAVAEMMRNTVAGLAGRALTGPESFEQIPALADRGRRRTVLFMGLLDDRLAQSKFVVGDSFSMADISAMVVIDFSTRAKLPPPDELGHLARWYGEVSTRPSASA